MKNLFEKYIQSVSAKFSHEETSEMGYRTDFEILLGGVFESMKIQRIDHDAKVRDGNKPDFAIIKNNIPILYVEAKDIGVSLDKVEQSEQMSRYYGYANLVLTDYVEFRFYRNGQRYEDPVKIANFDIKSRTITPIPENYEHVAKSLLDFTKSHKEPIKSGKHLAKIMGGKAQRIRDNVRQFLASDSSHGSELSRVYETIKKLLVHDITPDKFSDMYAQTLVYGLFVARYHDDTPETFSRQEARDLIPASNPFLGHFFDHIAGRSFEKRLAYIVDELCEVFSHADVQELMKEYFKDDLWGETHKGPDPVIHFYEDFLKEYDEDLRKKMGAYYTPLPVVQFIVRSVDYLLEKEFGLTNGLADTSKTANGLHRVQILDPAVGTGTFISDVIGKIYTKISENGQKGSWPQYVHHDLLPRLYGFELMMAPYTIAHLKLSMALRETGFKYFNETRSGKARLGIYLTNSLEDIGKHPDLLAFDFAASIAEEAEEASKIKNEKPVMVVLGNPPYSGESSNNFESANRLIDKYKVEPGGTQKLKERNPKWLNDDYVKFISFSENLIEKNGEGILGFITNHGYLDNPTFRGMRWRLAQTFDDIYILDLHGNAKKKETSPDGSKDENVFNIQQGVAIILAIKKKDGRIKQDARVFVSNLYGKRESKFEALRKRDIKYAEIKLDPKQYYFVNQNLEGKDEYDRGFSVNDLFMTSSVGVVTGRDAIVISEDKNLLKKNIVTYANDPSFDYDEKKVLRISYRPFDVRYIYYDKSFIERGRWDVMQFFAEKNPNVGFIFKRGGIEEKSSPVFLSNFISESRSWSRPGMEGIESLAPLYLYDAQDKRIPNIDQEIWGKIGAITGKTTPENILDYIYASLHSPRYREKYKEFLKIDFPRVSYPKDKKQFFDFAKIGEELRHLHLMESPRVNKLITTYPEVGDDVVEKVKYENGNVYINEKQYFGNAPEIAWNFYIGGYQPAQKWLKDRKGRTLSNEDIEHYQKIIVILVETERLMREADKIV